MAELSFNPMKSILDRSDGKPHGILSVCCSNEFVIKTAMEYAKQRNCCFFIEATVNQVNQFGGYTGMKPRDFVELIHRIADEIQFPLNQVVMAGDHLGPFIWQQLTEHEAMSLSEELVAQYVAAGFRKIHLDVSMRLASDDKNKPLDVETVARRTARLARVSETVYAATRSNTPWPYRPVYIIGSEVPVPGGTEIEEEMEVTRPEELLESLAIFKNVLLEENLSEVWKDVRAVVAQIGVEFSDESVHDYNHKATSSLSNALKEYSGIVFEAHSSDYQNEANLRQMLYDGVGILKVGPELTFAFREGLFALAMMEQELLSCNLSLHPSKFIEILDTVMMQSMPNYWIKYYHGNPCQQAFKRKYSFSDRSRYYFSDLQIKKSLMHLLENMDKLNIPLPLVSQYMPIQYDRIRRGIIDNRSTTLVKDKITCVLDRYYASMEVHPVQVR